MKLTRAFLQQWSTGNLSWLYFARLLQDVGTIFLSIFGPIYIFIQFDQRVDWYLIFLLGIDFMSLFFTPLLAPKIIKGSLKKIIYIAIPLAILYYASVNLIATQQFLFGLAAIVFLAGFRMFFWVPYHSQVAKFSEVINRGKQINVLFVAMAIIGIFLPIVSGFVIEVWGFVWLYLVASLFWLLSLWPLSKVDDVVEYFSWGAAETWHYFFHAHNRRQVVAYMAEGMNDAGQLLIWPIVIWLLLAKHYVYIGLLVGAVVFATALVRLFLANYIDQHSKKKVLFFGSWLTGLAWLARIIIYSPLQIFIVDSFYNLSTSTLKTSFDTIMYGKAADSDHYVDEYTVIREMAIYSGRLIMLVVALLSFIFLPAWWIVVTFLFISLMTYCLRWQADGYS